MKVQLHETSEEMRKTGESLTVALSGSRRFFRTRMPIVRTRGQGAARIRSHMIGGGKTAKRILAFAPAFLSEFIVTFVTLPGTRDSLDNREARLPVWILLFSGVAYYLIVNWCIFPNSDTYGKR